MHEMNLQETEDTIVAWLREQAKNAGAKGLIVGLSGGVDSSVVASLCKKAMPGQCFGLIMPCGSISQDAEHAKMIAEKIKMPYKTIDLGPGFEVLSTDLKSKSSDLQGNEKLAIANIKPRLRMTALYYFANKLNYLVVGTDNKTESMLGYFTKFGDGGVDLLPISCLYKKDVRALARHLGVPGKIIEKPPSAGLWQGQTDEGEMGLSYEDADSILEKIEQGNTAGADPEKLQKVQAMIKASEHKRNTAPVCSLGGA
jgi:NAD+ synthase